ncbi:hypothetical protein C8R44DRAFT_992864 [Mycena epipterygia]|nr:hypothetical protein C8R44DRAFT_992864 [Mycena epipterygia]
MARQLALTVKHCEVVTTRLPALFESLFTLVPVASLPLHLSPSNPVYRPLSPLTIINGFCPPSLLSLAIVFFICAPSFGLPGHISIDSAVSLRNKLLPGSISPQQQLQYQQAAPRNHNTYVSSPPPTLPVFPVARPPRPCSRSRPRNDYRDRILYYSLDGNRSYYTGLYDYPLSSSMETPPSLALTDFPRSPSD